MGTALGVLDGRLDEREYLADEYSVADLATYPWIKAACPLLGSDDYPHIGIWLERVGARPAVEPGMQVSE